MVVAIPPYCRGGFALSLVSLWRFRHFAGQGRYVVGECPATVRLKVLCCDHVAEAFQCPLYDVTRHVELGGDVGQRCPPPPNAFRHKSARPIGGTAVANQRQNGCAREPMAPDFSRHDADEPLSHRGHAGRASSVADDRRRRRDWADLSASRAKYALRACSARFARSAGVSFPSGSTSCSKRSSAALRAFSVLAARSSVLAHDVWAAICARSARSDLDKGTIGPPSSGLASAPGLT